MIVSPTLSQKRQSEAKFSCYFTTLQDNKNTDKVEFYFVVKYMEEELLRLIVCYTSRKTFLHTATGSNDMDPITPPPTLSNSFEEPVYS